MSANPLHKIQWGNLANHNTDYVDPAEFNKLLDDKHIAQLLKFRPNEKAVIINCFGRLRILTNFSRLMSWFISSNWLQIHIVQAGTNLITTDTEHLYATSVDKNVAFEHFHDLLQYFRDDDACEVHRVPVRMNICLPHSFTFSQCGLPIVRHTLKHNKGCSECSYLTSQYYRTNVDNHLKPSLFTRLLVEQLLNLKNTPFYIFSTKHTKDQINSQHLAAMHDICEMIRGLMCSESLSDDNNDDESSSDDDDNESSDDDGESLTDDNDADDNDDGESLTDESTDDNDDGESLTDESTDNDTDSVNPKSVEKNST